MPGNGWPADWDDRMAGKDCPMCASLGQGDNSFTIAVADLPFSEVRLDRRSLLPGYCIVVWRHGHIAEPTELAPDAAAGYWRDVVDVSRAIQVRFEPVKLNFLTLGNFVPHLHTHVLPRYHDDPAPSGPIPWEAISSEIPTPLDTLQRQAAELRRVLPA